MRASSLHAKNGVGSRPEAGSRPSLRSDAARRWRRRLGVACRLIGARIALFLLVTVLAFAILRAMPADPVLITLAERNLPATPEAVAVLTRHFGLDRPIPEQYARWLVRFLSGDWSVSLRTDLPVRAEISARAPLSLAIGGGGLAVAILLAVPLGFAASARPRGLADRLSRLLAVAAQAVPVFWVGLMLLWLLGVHLRLFQPYGSDGATRLLLSVALIALYSCGSLSRVVRIEFLRVVQQPYFRTALAKGLRRRTALWRHGRRHVAITLVAAVVPEAAWVVGGTAVTEVVFAVPGFSQFAVDSVAARDYPVLQAYVVVVAAWMVAVHSAAGLLSLCLDPRLARSA